MKLRWPNLRQYPSICLKPKEEHGNELRCLDQDFKRACITRSQKPHRLIQCVRTMEMNKNV